MPTEPPPTPSGAPPQVPDRLLARRQALQLMGLGLVVAGGGLVALRAYRSSTEDTLHLVSPELSGPLPPELLKVLLTTGRLVSQYLGFEGDAAEDNLEAYLRQKCGEVPSYLGTYTRYAASVTLPAQFSAEWLEGVQELYRSKVVGEIAIMLLISGGFRALGFNNFNGYMGGSWHNPQESHSFRPDGEP